MKQILLLVFAIVSTEACFATTVMTPAQIASYGLAKRLEFIVEENKGDLPINLIALFGEYPDRLESFEKTVGAKLDERFRFMKSERLSDPQLGLAIILTRDKVYEDRRAGDGIGRYVIWRKDGVFRSSWEPEGKMQKLFSDAGLALESNSIWKQPATKYITNPPVMDGTEPDGTKLQTTGHPSAGKTSPSNLPQPNMPALPLVEDEPAPMVPWFAGIIALVLATWFLLKRRS